MRRLIPTIMLVIGLCSSVAFAGLAPTKPSQLADLTTTYATPCPQDFPDADVYLIDSVNASDGTSKPFVIPPRQVFVITSVEIVGQLITAGHSYFLTLTRLDGTHLGFPIVNGSGTTATSGRVSVYETIPYGSVVKSGSKLCVGAFDGTTGSVTPEVSIHGYFTKDN